LVVRLSGSAFNVAHLFLPRETLIFYQIAPFGSVAIAANAIWERFSGLLVTLVMSVGIGAGIWELII